MIEFATDEDNNDDHDDERARSQTDGANREKKARSIALRRSVARMASTRHISIDIYVYTCISSPTESGFRPDPTSQLGSALSSKFGHRRSYRLLTDSLHG